MDIRPAFETRQELRPCVNEITSMKRGTPRKNPTASSGTSATTSNAKHTAAQPMHLGNGVLERDRRDVPDMNTGSMYCGGGLSLGAHGGGCQKMGYRNVSP
jgi:hypothetical protein